jgi:4-amino-4-deoxy-L-arabinose transferase
MSGNGLITDKNASIKISCLAIIGLFLLLYIAPLGVTPLAIPDETRYAEIPREMIASGDWVVPHLDGLRYFEKPAMGYWLNAISIMVFGENEFAARFPSAIATGLSALMLFFLARRFSGGYLSGILTASIFLLSIEVFAVGSFSVLDAPFSLFITATVIFYFFAVMEPTLKKKRLFLALSGATCGLAFLTKGFLAFALPMIIIVPYMIWERRFKELLKSLWIPALLAVLISLPWCILIHLRAPDFWNFFFWNEHIRRFTAGSAQHNESFWYFFKVFPLAILPWTFLVPAAWIGMRKDAFNNSITKFSLCWCLVPFLFFSVSSGKLLTYILPCFPPLAILLGSGVNKYLASGKKRAFNIGALLFILFICLFALILPVFQLAGYHGLKPYAHLWKPALLTASLFSWALCTLYSIRASDNKKKILLYAIAPALFMFAVHFCIPEMTIARKMPGDFLLTHCGRINSDTIIVTDEAMVSSACWFYKRSNVYLLGNYGELGYGLGYADSKYRHLDPDQFRDFILQHKETGPVTLIAKAKTYKKWKDNFPQPVFEDSNGKDGLVFVQF